MMLSLSMLLLLMMTTMARMYYIQHASTDKYQCFGPSENTLHKDTR